MKLVAQTIAILGSTICSRIRQLCRGHIRPLASIVTRYLIIHANIVICIVDFFWLMDLATKEDQQHNIIRCLHRPRHDKRHPEMIAPSE